MLKWLSKALERIYRWFVPRKPKIRHRIEFGYHGPFDEVDEITEVKLGLWRGRRRRR